MSISLSAQLRVRSTGLAGIGEPSNLSWISHSLNIFGTGTNNSGGAIAFGDNSSTTKNVVIGEYTGDSDVLLLHGKNGLSLSTGSSISQKIKINSSGYMSLGTTTTYGRITMYCNSSAEGVGIYGTSGTFRLYTIGEDAYLTRGGSDSKGIKIGNNGHIGINGYVSDSYWLYVSGNCRADKWETYSDSTYKKDITKLERKDKLSMLKPVSYTWNEEKFQKEHKKNLILLKMEK